MSRAVLALLVVCSALAVWAVAPAVAGTTVSKSLDLTMEIQPDRMNPCTGQNDLTIAFLGYTKLHIVEKIQDGLVVSARVDVDQAGGLATTINGVDYLGFLTYSSKVNLNNQNQNASVEFAVAAWSLDGLSSLVFSVSERVTFNASDPTQPASGATRVSIGSCPA